MGHALNVDREYRLLQRKLDCSVTGAPYSPALMKILRLLFSPEDAELARKIPGMLTPLEDLSAKLGIPGDELEDKLTELARRGLVFDMEHRARRYFALAPVVIGFFEFTFMRVREDLPLGELARLFEQYMEGDDRFARSVFNGRTQLGRSLVREEALRETDHTEILDWERASELIRSASAIGVSLCACRHKASHLGEACQQPQRCCLSLNYAATTILRAGLAEPLSADQALRILDDCKQSGLAQTSDNVRRNVTYICNCCGCCCGMMRAVRSHGMRGAIVTSNWIMQVDAEKCRGCGRCVQACPVHAVQIVQRPDKGGEPGERAVLDEGLCLGCGVCCSVCQFGAASMKSRPKRAYTPETVFERFAAMALERGKLADLVFERPERLTHRALARIVKLIEKSPPFRVAVAIRPLRSAFLNGMVTAAKRSTGPIAERFE